MEKIWLKSYPPDVPSEISLDIYSSLVDFFESSCQKFRNLPAFHHFGSTLTYHEFDQYSLYFAAYLQKSLKIKKGDRIAIMLPNTLHYPIILFGILRVGGVVVNTNPLYTVDELQHQMQDSGAETIIVLDMFAHTVEKVLPHVATLKNIIVAQFGDFCFGLKRWVINFALKYIYRKIPTWHIPNAISFCEILAAGRLLTLAPASLSHADLAFLQYTGGTTGIAKGAMLTHGNLIANIEQAYTWCRSILVDGKEIVITALPLYHIFSLLANCLFGIKIGCFNILITDARNLNDLIKEMGQFKFTVITGVNTLFSHLLKHKKIKQLNFNSLKFSLGGGSAVQHLVAEQWYTVTGSVLLEAYGLTEASPCVTINPITLTAYNGTVGLPVSSTEICILDDQGKELSIGQVGELAVRGPQVMLGYWNNPGETKKVFTKTGWLLTGDIAMVNKQGYVSILERKKDMIIVSGFNVYPNEIEDVLINLAGVQEVAVIGVPSASTGEKIKVFIVKNNPSLTTKEVITYCQQHLTGYKIPKIVEFCNELPKSNVGKILRKKLRAS